MEFNDVNEWHQVTDRDAYIRAGRPMIEIRCMSGSSGTMLEDMSFKQHRNRFKNFPRLYYFFPFNKAPAREQAKWFADKLITLEPTEMIMLDIEEKSNVRDPVAFTKEFLEVIEALLPGNRCWVYVSKAVASENLYRVIGDRIIKSPKYSGTAKVGPRPNWGRYDVHQYSDRGWMPGSLQGPGDINITPLSVEQLFARSKTTTPIKINYSGSNLLLLDD